MKNPKDTPFEAREREVFEAWAKEHSISLTLDWDQDEYGYPTTKFAWWGWIARATRGVALGDKDVTEVDRG